MLTSKEVIEQTLFCLEELLWLVNDGCEQKLAIESIIRLCGYRCENYIIESSGLSIVHEKPSDWLE